MSRCMFFTCTQTSQNQTFDVDSDVNDTTDLGPLADSTTETSADTALMPIVPNDAEQPPADTSNFTGTDVLDSTLESVDSSIPSPDAL